MSTFKVIVEATDFEDALSIAATHGETRKTTIAENTTDVSLVDEKFRCPDCTEPFTVGVYGQNSAHVHCNACNKNFQL